MIKKLLQGLSKEDEREKTTHIVMVSGYAGTGKSTVGKSIAKELGSVYLDKDTVGQGFTEKILKDNNSHEGDRESDIYHSEISPMEYETIINLAVENVSLGNDVVLTAPFISQLQEEDWVEINVLRYFEADVKLSVIWLYTDERTERVRLTERGSKRDKWKLDNWEEYADKVRVFKPENEYIHLFNNKEEMTAETYEERIKELVENITREGEGIKWKK